MKVKDFFPLYTPYIPLFVYPILKKPKVMGYIRKRFRMLRLRFLLRKLRKGKKDVILNDDRRCELIRHLKMDINMDKALLKKAQGWDMCQYEKMA